MFQNLGPITPLGLKFGKIVATSVATMPQGYFQCFLPASHKKSQWGGWQED